MDAHMHRRNSQIADAHNSRPPALRNPHGTDYLSAADEYNHRFLSHLGAPGLAFPSAIASDRGLLLPWEGNRHDLGSSMANPHIGLADAAHFAVSPIQGSWTGESFPGRFDALLSADASRDFLPRYNASVLSSMHAANPVIPTGFADLNAQLQGLAASEILHRTEFDPVTSLGYSWPQMLGAPQVDPAAAMLRTALSAHAAGGRLGKTLSFDNYIPTGGRSVVTQEQTNPLLSIPNFLGAGQSFESMSALPRVPAEINETSLDAQPYLYASSHPLLEVRRRSSASVGGLAFTQLPQEMHTLAQPVQNVKRRKFQHEWEKEDSWSRDEYDDADDQDTGTTDAGKSQVESSHKLCIQPTDQNRCSKTLVDSWNHLNDLPSGDYDKSDEKSNKAFAWTDVYVPEGSKISKETDTTLQICKGTSQQGESDHSRVKSKHKRHKNAGLPKESHTAAISSEEMTLWPPAVVIYNTRTGKTAEGVWDGMGGKEMDTYLNGLGHSQGKSRPIWGRQGHKGLVIVKYKPNLSGLQEAERLHKHFEVNRRGRQQWLQINGVEKGSGNDSELKDGPDFVHVDAATNESKRILYGFLAGPSDVENFDPGSKIKFAVESKSEILKRQRLLERKLD